MIIVTDFEVVDIDVSISQTKNGLKTAALRILRSFEN